jgi:hypothetical protein
MNGCVQKGKDFIGRDGEEDEKMTAEEIVQALGKVTRLCEVTRLRVGEYKCKENCPFALKKDKNPRCILKTPPTTMTNADKIRSMNDEQLADWIMRYVEPCALCAYYKCGEGCSPPPNTDCETGRLEWLKQEHKENSND